jgi:hypothetical protein
MLGNSLVASQEGLSSMKLVSQFNKVYELSVTSSELLCNKRTLNIHSYEINYQDISCKIQNILTHTTFNRNMIS